MTDPGPFSRYSGRDEHEVVAVGPAECVNGHPLVYPNVQARGAATSITWVCRQCGANLTQHSDGTVTHGQEAPF